MRPLALNTFQLAAKRASAKYTAEEWACLRPADRAAAVYRAMQDLDAKAIRQPPQYLDRPAVS